MYHERDFPHPLRANTSWRQFRVRFLGGILTVILTLSLVPALNVFGYIAVKPSRRWGVFFGTIGDVKIDITDPGVAVRVGVPRAFLEGTTENDTSHVTSDISNDYFYYSVIDQSLHYPYDANSPYAIEIWNPPKYSPPSWKAIFYNFTDPRYVLLQGLNAPDIAGIYNFTVYVAKKMGSNNRPIFPLLPDKVVQVPVSMREDPGHITGYIYDDIYGKPIKAKGVVYAIETSTGRIGMGYVNSSTGFFNVTGLYAGEYRLEGSAGNFSETGCAYAITTSTFTVGVNKGLGVAVPRFALLRGCTIRGTIAYTDRLGNSIRPLDSPYLAALKYPGLNYTVEAYDSKGEIVASKTYQSNNIPAESYAMVVREGATYVGYPAKGSEYAGFGPDTYTVKIWVYGFVLPQSQIKKAIFAGYNTMVNVGVSTLPYGGVVSGKIKLLGSLTGALENPRQGEAATFGSVTGRQFGGNVLVHAYSDGVLRGLVVLNRTFQNGVVQYADCSSGDQTPLLRFYVLGFSEHYNRSYSGVWAVGSSPGPSPWDYGLEAGTYVIRVWIRGYLPGEVREVSVGEGGNETVTVNMVRGGAAQVTVGSWNNKPGTRMAQASQPWRHMDLSPSPVLRVYFYDAWGGEVGYAESVLQVGSPGVSDAMATLNFTGHNWTIDEITLQGYVPTTLKTGNHTLRAHTYGYIQPRELLINIYPGVLVRSYVTLLIGCGIHGNVPLMTNGLFIGLTENATMRAEVILNDVLKGTDVVNATVGTSLFSFNTYGLHSRGHFFYVDENGIKWKDYGLDTGTYRINIPILGYDRKFYQPMPINAYLQGLSFEVGINFHVERMIKIYGIVTGDTFTGVPPVVTLAWVKVKTNSYTAYTFDGDYALHLPPSAGALVTYSVSGYKSVTLHVVTNDQAEMNINLEESGVPFP
jgi:hypothetical protein